MAVLEGWSYPHILCLSQAVAGHFQQWLPVHLRTSNRTLHFHSWFLKAESHWKMNYNVPLLSSHFPNPRCIPLSRPPLLVLFRVSHVVSSIRELRPKVTDLGPNSSAFKHAGHVLQDHPDFTDVLVVPQNHHQGNLSLQSKAAVFPVSDRVVYYYIITYVCTMDIFMQVL